MKKFFQTDSEDGAVIHRKDLDSKTIGIKINTDGLVYLGGLEGVVQEGFGVVFGGTDVFASYFKSGVPEGESLMLQNNKCKRIVFTEGCFSESESLNSESAHNFIDSYLHTGSLQAELRRCDLLAGSSRIDWNDAVEESFWLPSVERTHLSDSAGNMIGYVGSEKVLLTKLPPHPPTGYFEISGGIRIREVDLWKRKYKKLVSSSTLSQRILSIKGLFESNGEKYIVSTFPLNVEALRLSSPSTSHDCLVDVLYECLGILRELSGLGVAWNGLINRNSFITTSDGDIYLNTGYLLTRFTDEFKLFGGQSIEELRFMSPNQIVRCSIQTKFMLQCMGYEIPAPESISRGETRNLALLIASLLKGDEGYPAPWLSDPQFILVNWLAGVEANHPAANLLSVLCEEPVNDSDPSEVQLNSIDNVDPLLRIAHRLMEGSLNLDELVSNLESYIQWRDKECAETSVETEVKAVFSKVSAFIQSGQEVMKSALTKSIENSW